MIPETPNFSHSDVPNTASPAPRRQPLHRCAAGVLIASAVTFLLLLSVFLFSPASASTQNDGSSPLQIPLGIGSHIVSNAVPMIQGETLFVQRCLESQLPGESASAPANESSFTTETVHSADTGSRSSEAVIDDDATPMSSSPADKTEPTANNEPEPAKESKNQPSAAAENNKMSPGTISILGATVSYVDAIESAEAPKAGAGLWLGDDSTNDGSYGFFIGHNPGDFTAVMELAKGDTVYVCDRSGEERAYTVVFANRLASTTNWYDIDEQYTCYGESVILQTCWGDGKTNKIVMAVAEE